MNSLHLRAAGTSILILIDDDAARIAHWGADLGARLPDLDVLVPPVPHSAFDTPTLPSLIPQASEGWLGRRGLRGHRIIDGTPGFAFSPALRVVTATAEQNSAEIVQADRDSGLDVRTRLVLHPSGLLEVSSEVRNTADTAYVVEELAIALPVPPIASELLDLSGRWCREAHPQRQQVREGTWTRAGRHGRTGHDSSLLMMAGTPGFSNRTGTVWAAHLAWSGDHEQFFDAAPGGWRMLGASELLGSGELVLAPGGTYRTPTLFAAYSDRGIDGASARFHDSIRARPTHPRRARPVVLNTWEAVYFDHRLEPLIELADTAADLGVERFVLDDGWFHGRRDDTRGLGDWWVDAAVWPEGLTPLITAVRDRGMEFGLWVEPEMISLDSDTARRHPDWVVGIDERRTREWRHQHVIDLTNPDAFEYVFDRLDALLIENDIAYLKWDQNRDHTELAHGGRPSTHAQTLAAYRLFDELRAAHPEVEIESCSSGGGRVDLGILARTDRVWASDCNDALERQTIQRWMQALLPPELVGSHVGPSLSHTTGRTHDITFRAITALFGHFGIEWDIRAAAPRDLAVLRRIIALYKVHRPLLHSGTRVNADTHDPNLALHGVVAVDGRSALFAAVATGSLIAQTPGRVTIPGLDPEQDYRIEAAMPLDVDLPDDVHSAFAQIAPPPWVAGGAEATGRFLSEVGLPLPILRPEQALLLTVSPA